MEEAEGHLHSLWRLRMCRSTALPAQSRVFAGEGAAPSCLVNPPSVFSMIQAATLQHVRAMQDRIAKDGSLVYGNAGPTHGPAAQQQIRPAYLPSTAPAMPPISEEHLQGLAELVANSRCQTAPFSAGSRMPCSYEHVDFPFSIQKQHRD